MLIGRRQQRTRLLWIIVLCWIVLSCLIGLRSLTSVESLPKVLSAERSLPVIFSKGVEEMLVDKQKSDFKGQPLQINKPHDSLKTGLGEMGLALKIEPESLNATEREKYDRLWMENAFNGYASDLISLHRQLPDMRDTMCRQLIYNHSLLPRASVIIIFHNEAWSALLRTVHSVIDHSPPSLLQEIILVDDCSTRDYLKSALDTYIGENFSNGKIKIVRLAERQGLIRARLKGADHAMAEVLIFLDSHCEATVGWLEPLLDPIAKNNRTAIVPIIETIDDSTLAVSNTPIESIQVGGFSWSLIFNWHSLSKSEREKIKNRTDAVRTPTMAGGLFAINSNWFNELGRYDDGMDIWGGENMEISFKVWLCGGELLSSTCSHVGHIFRKRSPYAWPSNQNVVLKNTMRVAKVWLNGRYFNYYLDKDNEKIHGDLSERFKLKEKLKCKDFEWYHRNIYPEIFTPDDCTRSGEIKNLATSMCVDASLNQLNSPIIGYPCHGQGGNQIWFYTKSKEIRRDDLCMDYSFGSNDLGQADKIRHFTCHNSHGNQEWSIMEVSNDNGGGVNIKHSSGFCLSISKPDNKLVMDNCRSDDPHQQWTWPTRHV